MAADYYAILKNAIGALPETSGEARRAVYEKARRAVVDQLKAFDPPLSATERETLIQHLSLLRLPTPKAEFVIAPAAWLRLKT